MIFRQNKLRSIIIWCSLLTVSIVIHFILSWYASPAILRPDTLVSQDEIETLLQLVEKPERESLLFEESIDFSPPPGLVPTSAVAPPPPKVNLAMPAAAGGNSPGRILVPVLADVPVTAGKGAAGFGSGTGLGSSNSANQFAAYVESLRETGLDVVFVVDTTGSMDWVLSEVNTRIVDIVDTVRMLVPVARFGVVAYRDQGEPEYVTRLQTLTFSLGKLSTFLSMLTARGGGSYQEAVYEGVLLAVEKGGWRLGAKKVIVVIGDGPPHKNSFARLLAVSRKFAQDHGQISVLDVGSDANPAVIEARLGRTVNRALYTEKPMLDYQLLAEAGGGVASTLDGDVEITRQLVSLIMGGQFSQEMALLMEGL